VIQFSYNSKKVELFDPSQARDNTGKWTGSGGDGKESLSGTTSVYHGTTADVLSKIRETGLKPSKDGVHGKGVYATDNQRLALEYGCLKAPQATKIGGKVLLGIVEVVASGFKSVYEEKRDKDPYKVFLSEKEVLPSAIKRMMIFDAKPVRKWIFEGGEKPKPIAVKNLEEGTIFVPILIDSADVNLEEVKCPVETQDIKANLANRQEAIDIAHYGPANPKEPNKDYWKAKAGIFKGSVEEAKTMRCGNCAGFNQTSKLIDCITKGIGMDAKEVEQAGDLGFCEIFDFKCASLRTCDAWIVGGPITDKTNLQELRNKLVALRDSKEFFDPSQARDESGKWTSQGSPSSGSKSSENTPKTTDKERIGALAGIAQKAKVAVNYGASKASEIKNWLNSPKGVAVQNAVSATLRSAFKGAIQSVRTAHDNRYKILIGSLINPTLGIEIATASAIKGFVQGALEEYQSHQGGRSISNAIRTSAGLKMSACGNAVTLEKEPDMKDVADYITDSILVAIKEAYEKRGKLEVTTFFDPSQERDESGKWTSGGGSTEPSMPIYDEDENKPISPIGDSAEEVEQSKEIEQQLDKKEMEYADEFMQVLGPPTLAKNEKANREEYKKDVVEWSKEFAKSDVDTEDAKYIAQTLHHYAGSQHQEINNYLRTMDEQENPNLEIMGMAEGMLKAIEVAPKIKESQIWRGIKSGTEKPLKEDYVHNLAKRAKVGMTITDEGFPSFSLRESVGKQFSNWDMGQKGVQSKILIKVKNANGVGVKMPIFASSFINEKEVLLPAGTTLKVLSVKKTKEKINPLFKGEDTHVYHAEIDAEITQ
jgi:hypothetical protein